MRFGVNWDYRCPFARNLHEHLVLALSTGADWDVDFVPFSLSQVHLEEGEPDVWSDPTKRKETLAVLTGMAVNRFFPDRFFATHLALFGARHDQALDLTDTAVLAAVLEAQGLEPEKVFHLIESEGLNEEFRRRHLSSVSELHVFGVPTFIFEDKAVFARIMTRPQGDAKLARRTIEYVLETITGHPELNELKYTTIAR
jgi:hypothetical protein